MRTVGYNGLNDKICAIDCTKMSHEKMSSWILRLADGFNDARSNAIKGKR